MTTQQQSATREGCQESTPTRSDGLRALPVVEQCGWYVRTAVTETDREGVIVANSGYSSSDIFVFAQAHGDTVAGLTAEAINTARETGLSPNELNRQRLELLDALKWHFLDEHSCPRCGRMATRCIAHTAIAHAEGRS